MTRVRYVLATLAATLLLAPAAWPAEAVVVEPAAEVAPTPAASEAEGPAPPPAADAAAPPAPTPSLEPASPPAVGPAPNAPGDVPAPPAAGATGTQPAGTADTTPPSRAAGAGSKDEEDEPDGPDCGRAGSEAAGCDGSGPQAVRPTFSCVRPLGGGRYEARFGYDNPSARSTYVPAGPANRFSPAPIDRGQPRSFPPGARSSAFSVTFSGGSIAWVLNGRSASASSNAARCSGPPTCAQAGLPCTDIPEFPSAALGLGMGALGALLGATLRRRRRGQH